MTLSCAGNNRQTGFAERKTIIRDFEPKHSEEATEITLNAYDYEKAFTQELPETSGIPMLKQLSGNSLGDAAFEDRYYRYGKNSRIFA